MHDILPLKLFDVNNFVLLESIDEKELCAYSLPFMLLKTALQNTKVTINDRIDFLEIIIYYMQFYIEAFTKTKQNNRCLTKAKNPTEVTIFDLQLCKDVISTCLSINSILHRQIGEISLNRVGTNPLEHRFGLLRLKSKYQHNIVNLIREQAKLDAIHKIEAEVFDNLVSKRTKTFGDTVDITHRYEEGGSIFDNKLLALSLFEQFGLPSKKLSYRKGACEKEYAFKSIMHRLNQVVTEQSKLKKKLMTSHDVSLANSISKIHAKQENREIFLSERPKRACNNCKKKESTTTTGSQPL